MYYDGTGYWNYIYFQT